MAMFIVFASGSDVKIHVGEKIPESVTRDIQNVVEVQADGDEKSFIYGVFDNFPRIMESHRIVRYFGDQARFIVGNWSNVRYPK